MNHWAQKTLRIVKEKNYLDLLQEIYPHKQGEREISGRVLDAIRTSFKARNNIVLLNQLLDLEKFPYKDSYVAFLRKDRKAIDRNPETVKRICNNLYEMGIEGIISGVVEPKEANTRRGQQFSVWARSKFKWVDLDAFKASTNGIVMLDASEITARDFCNKEMGVGITKRPDLVAKAGRKYVVGEAKFLSATGGNQGRAFDDGMDLATNTKGIAYKVFILDGVHWIEAGSEQFKRIEYGTVAVFSALLLQDFLKTIQKAK